MADGYVPPQAVRNNAKRGLELRKNTGGAVRLSEWPVRATCQTEKHYPYQQSIAWCLILPAMR
jgi:hypothetical protein